MLANIIKKFYSGKICNIYFHNSFNITHNTSKKISYISSRKYINYIVELLCRNTDGQTIGYKKEEDNKITPVLEDIDSGLLLKWGFNDYIEGIKDYCINACKFETENNVSLQSLNLYKNYYDYVTKKLDKETADIIGSIPYQSAGSEKIGSQAAPEYKFNDYIKFIIKGYSDDYFPFISLPRSSKFFNKIYKFIKKYGGLRKFLINAAVVYDSKKRVRLTFLGLKLSFAI